jgi:uncharacterized iron-regulated protein
MLLWWPRVIARLREETSAMKPVPGIALLVLLTAALISQAAADTEKQPLPELAPELQAELTDYLNQHWMSPEDYVVSKFADHDIVFLGEYHRIKHDVQLVQNLIPCLYAAGVYNLGIEFCANEMQDEADRLITAQDYDEAVARRIMFQSLPFWGYTEYMDLYRAAWRLNKSLPEGARRFRVVNLMYIAKFELLKEGMTPEDWQQVWHRGDPDEFMANVILREFVDKREKALIYSGNHHAFTRYRQPAYNFQEKKLYRLNDERMGNRVFAKIGERAFNIFLHSPWTTKEGFDSHSYPVGGAIDRVMLEFPDKRVGFDVRGTPFGRLPDEDTYYALGYDEFELGDYCDGYIFQRHFSDYEGVTPDPEFITEENFAQAIAWLPNLEARKRLTRPSELLDAVARDADIQRRFSDLR